MYISTYNTYILYIPYLVASLRILRDFLVAAANFIHSSFSLFLREYLRMGIGETVGDGVLSLFLALFARCGLLALTGEWAGDIMGLTETVSGKEGSGVCVVWGWGDETSPNTASNMAILGFKLGGGVWNGVPGGGGVTWIEWGGRTGAGVWNWVELTLGVKLISASSVAQGWRGRWSISAVLTPPSDLTMSRISESLKGIRLWKWPAVCSSSSK